MTDATVTSPPVSASASNRRTDAPRLRWWERVSFTAAHAALSPLLTCLSLSGLYRFARLFGTLEWSINYRRRRRFGRAFDRITGGKADPARRRRAAREFFCRTRCDKIFYLIFDRIPHETAGKLFSIENRALLDDALAKGRGVYVALSHHGPHHVAGLLMVRLGYKIAGVRDRKEGAIRRYVQNRLDHRWPQYQKNFRILYANAYPREVYRCFQDGFALGSAMDVSRTRLPHQKVEEVTIFGEKRRFLSGPLRVAMRCHAPIIQGFIIPLASFHYRLELVGPLVERDQFDNEDDTVRCALEAYTRNVEDYVRRHPELITRI